MNVKSCCAPAWLLSARCWRWCTTAAAQRLKPWRHGVLEAKSDAGFVFMASKGGFAEKQGLKIEMLQFKGDALALRLCSQARSTATKAAPAAR